MSYRGKISVIRRSVVFKNPQILKYKLTKMIINFQQYFFTGGLILMANVLLTPTTSAKRPKMPFFLNPLATKVSFEKKIMYTCFTFFVYLLTFPLFKRAFCPFSPFISFYKGHCWTSFILFSTSMCFNIHFSKLLLEFHMKFFILSQPSLYILLFFFAISLAFEPTRETCLHLEL